MSVMSVDPDENEIRLKVYKFCKKNKIKHAKFILQDNTKIEFGSVLDYFDGPLRDSAQAGQVQGQADQGNG